MNPRQDPNLPCENDHNYQETLSCTKYRAHPKCEDCRKGINKRKAHDRSKVHDRPNPHEHKRLNLASLQTNKAEAYYFRYPRSLRVCAVPFLRHIPRLTIAISLQFNRKFQGIC